MRQIEFRDRLTALCGRYRVTRIYREFLPPMDAFSNRNATIYEHQIRIIAEIDAFAALGLREGRLTHDVEAVHAADWRMRLLGRAKPLPGYTGERGRDELKQAAVAACLRMGWIVVNDNEADACGILHYALGCIDRKYLGRTDSIFRRAQLNADIEHIRAGGRVR